MRVSLGSILKSEVSTSRRPALEQDFPSASKDSEPPSEPQSNQPVATLRLPQVAGFSPGSVSKAAALFVLALLAYMPIFPGTFLMDDLRLVQTENPLVNGHLSPTSIWFGMDFPLSSFMLWLEWLTWGKNPGLYHAVNLALHAFSAVIVWRILKRLRIPGAWLAGAFFAVHPVCVNSVARIAEIKNTLSLPFFLLSALCYFRYEVSALYPSDRQKGGRYSNALFYAVSLIAFVLALLSKTSTIMLPIALLTCAVWQRGKLHFRDLIHTGPHFLLAFWFGLMSVWFQAHQALAGVTLPPAGFLERLIIASRVFWFYLGKALLPVNLGLVYPRWKVDPDSAAAFLPLAAICAAFILLWHFRRSWGRHIFFGLGCYLALLFPALGFFDSQFLTRWQVSDHLQYLPLIALVSLATAFLSAGPKLKIVRRCVACAALLVLIASTFQRARIFTSAESLMRDAAAKNPAATDAHNDLGAILAEQNRFPEALTQFMAAVQSDPGNASAQLNLAHILVMAGNLQEAEPHFLAVLKEKPFDPDAHIQLAELLSAQRRYAEARIHLLLASRIKPAPGMRLQLAALLHNIGEFQEAEVQLRQAVAEQPDSPEALNNLAWLLATSSDDQDRNGAEAVRYAERACQLTGFKESTCIGTLAAAYAETGRFSEAITTAETALRQQTAAGETRLAAISRQLLSLYRAGIPFHQTQQAGKVAAE
jgi:Flp pilus assembly protein TadD